MVVRWLLIVVGFLSLALGVLGIFLPVLPTTPFLLLSAACFAKSSQKFYDWLLNNKWLGNYIKDYKSGLGISRKVKIAVISTLWITIIISVIFISKLLIQILLLIIAISVTIHIAKIKTKNS